MSSRAQASLSLHCDALEVPGGDVAGHPHLEFSVSVLPANHVLQLAALMTKQIGHDLLVRGQSAADGPDAAKPFSGGVGGDLILNPVDLGR